MQSSKPYKLAGSFSFRKPETIDATSVHDLIEACKPLDTNSAYCNLLQCDHFSATCIVAERDGKICGWISGYIPPDKPDTLFVWQVAVAPHARGHGLAGKMLSQLLERDCCVDITRLETTITLDNAASWGLFKAFARRRNAELDAKPYYRRDSHFDGAHATEHLVTITFAEALKRAA